METRQIGGDTHGTGHTGNWRSVVKRLSQHTLGICCKAAGTSRSVAIEQEPKHLPAKQYANGALPESVEMPSIRSQS